MSNCCTVLKMSRCRAVIVTRRWLLRGEKSKYQRLPIHILQIKYGLGEMIKDFVIIWSVQTGINVRQQTKWKVVSLWEESICSFCMLLYHVVVVFSQKWAKCVSDISERRWKGNFVFLDFIYGSLETHSFACNPEACHWWALFSFMGGN